MTRFDIRLEYKNKTGEYPLRGVEGSLFGEFEFHKHGSQLGREGSRYGTSLPMRILDAMHVPRYPFGGQILQETIGNDLQISHRPSSGGKHKDVPDNKCSPGRGGCGASRVSGRKKVG